MTISPHVQQELSQASKPGAALSPISKKRAASGRYNVTSNTFMETSSATYLPSENKGQPWTDEEHQLFLEGLKLYPQGPWKAIAEFVGTKNARQTMTHAQKYRQKHERQLRKKNKKKNSAKKSKENRLMPKKQIKAEINVPLISSTDNTVDISTTQNIPSEESLVEPPSQIINLPTSSLFDKDESTFDWDLGAFKEDVFENFTNTYSTNSLLGIDCGAW